MQLISSIGVARMFVYFISFCLLSFCYCESSPEQLPNQCTEKIDLINLTGSEVELVVSAFDEDLSWLAEIDVHTTVYVHNRSSKDAYRNSFQMGKPIDFSIAWASQKTLEARNSFRTHPIHFVDIPNVGEEHFAYLTHILQRYDNMPPAMVFLHGHRSAWHAPFNMDSKLIKTRFDPAEGYRNLNAGFKELNPKGNPSDGWCVGPTWKHEDLWRYGRHWADVFQVVQGPFPEKICHICCAQFVVSRERLLRVPRKSYEALHRFMQVDDGLPGPPGLGMEQWWRFLFAKPGELCRSDHDVKKDFNRDYQCKANSWKSEDSQCKPNKWTAEALKTLKHPWRA